MKRKRVEVQTVMINEEVVEVKACTKCGNVKALSDYYDDGKDSKRSICKVCYKTAQNKKNEERKRQAVNVHEVEAENALQEVFNYEMNEVRTAIIDGVAWFVAKDVCDVLEIKNVTQALQRLDEDERSMLNIGRQGFANIVNEYGLYSLTMSSRKKEAREFKRWVTHEVIPSIRKHGAYMSEKALEQALNNPNFMNGLVAELRDEKQKRLAAERERDEMLEESGALLEKATKYDELFEEERLSTLTVLGKQFLGGKSAAEIRKFLQSKGVLYDKKVDGAYVPTKKYDRYFKVIPFSKFDEEEGKVKVKGNTLKVTGEGVRFITNLFEQQDKKQERSRKNTEAKPSLVLTSYQIERALN